ncbi:protein YgfX [Granulosicoccus sp. 3-233]|uniref:protein YgfX n=1 Tax=Granulosicoccus sp. 3-233 TaxID=3417969 RepID=UPI003D334BC1
MARPGRPAINTSSTRCRTPWQAEAEPGRLHCYLIAGIGLTAATALLIHTPFDIWIRLALALCVLLPVRRQCLQTRRRRLKLLHEPDGSWKIESADQRQLSGQLVKAGYRSARLLILTIQTEDDRLHRYPIWCDQLTGREFSYLQQQLAYACETPIRHAGRATPAEPGRRVD